MNEMRLLERMDNSHNVGFRQYKFHETDLIESITKHVTFMLNVRQGSVLIRKDYGLADINDVTTNYDEATSIICSSIRYCIEQFEPRLHNVNVKHVANDSDPLKLRFDISGDIYFGRKFRRVWFETIMNPKGSVLVR